MKPIAKLLIVGILYTIYYFDRIILAVLPVARISDLRKLVVEHKNLDAAITRIALVSLLTYCFV
jgi:hypothetical protein